MNLSARQMLAHYEHVYGITPDRDEPPPERAQFDPVLAARIREGAARMDAEQELMRRER